MAMIVIKDIKIDCLNYGKFKACKNCKSILSKSFIGKDELVKDCFKASDNFKNNNQWP